MAEERCRHEAQCRAYLEFVLKEEPNIPGYHLRNCASEETAKMGCGILYHALSNTTVDWVGRKREAERTKAAALNLEMGLRDPVYWFD